MILTSFWGSKKSRLALNYFIIQVCEPEKWWWTPGDHESMKFNESPNPLQIKHGNPKSEKDPLEQPPFSWKKFEGRLWWELFCRPPLLKSRVLSHSGRHKHVSMYLAKLRERWTGWSNEQGAQWKPAGCSEVKNFWPSHAKPFQQPFLKLKFLKKDTRRTDITVVSKHSPGKTCHKLHEKDNHKWLVLKVSEASTGQVAKSNIFGPKTVQDPPWNLISFDHSIQPLVSVMSVRKRNANAKIATFQVWSSWQLINHAN